jgi:hypothetical protein
MRLKLAIAALLVCGVGFVLHERKSALENHLSQIATELGSRHVHVHCQSFAGNLFDVSGEAGTVQFDASGIPSSTTDLKRPICDALARFPHDVTSAGYACVYANADCPQKIWEDVLAVHTLAHEVWHLHGIRDEAQTECYALQTTARAAELFGADRGCAGDRRLRLCALLSELAGRVPRRRLRERRAVRSPAHRSTLALGSFDLRRDVGDLPVGDLLRDLLHLQHVRLRHLRTDLAEAAAVVSTRFIALVSTCGPRYDWSASTPIPHTWRSLAASSTPSPQPPATWKTTFAPAAIWFSAAVLHLA